MTGRPRFLWLLAALALSAAFTACSDNSLAVEIGGIWIADVHEFTNGAGDTVDLIAEGGSTTLGASFTRNGWRVSINIVDGDGEREDLFGVIEKGIFIIGEDVWTYSTIGDRMVVTDESATFDFGDGPEPATRTIELTRL